jgi:lipopolysaccharide/colanic/teichoic acid biosynthesis glycosyltransferase
MNNPFGLRGEQWIKSDYKRSIDVALAVGAMPVALPLGLTALGLARIADGDDVIFRQIRYGQSGRAFEIAKITTMKDSDAPDSINGKKATAFGRKIRSYGIDEIPQLTNVVNGTMSIVGPRAMADMHLEDMEAALDRNTYDEWLEAYHSSRPGGLSSYNITLRQPGFSERSHILKAKMDLEDFYQASLSRDFAIIKNAARIAVKRLAVDGAASVPAQQ